jgi:hypothetical protein
MIILEGIKRNKKLWKIHIGGAPHYLAQQMFETLLKTHCLDFSLSLRFLMRSANTSLNSFFSNGSLWNSLENLKLTCVRSTFDANVVSSCLLNCRLQSFSISNVSSCQSLVDVLVDILPRNHQLQRIYISDTEFTEKMYEKIAEALFHEDCNVNQLTFSSCSPMKWSLYAKIVRLNRSLTSFLATLDYDMKQRQVSQIIEQHIADPVCFLHDFAVPLEYLSTGKKSHLVQSGLMMLSHFIAIQRSKFSTHFETSLFKIISKFYIPDDITRVYVIRHFKELSTEPNTILRNRTDSFHSNDDTKVCMVS